MKELHEIRAKKAGMSVDEILKECAAARRDFENKS
jgi:hypothetical protein